MWRRTLRAPLRSELVASLLVLVTSALLSCHGSSWSQRTRYGEEVVDPEAQVPRMAAAFEVVLESELPWSLDPDAAPDDLPFDREARVRTQERWGQRLELMKENVRWLQDNLDAIDEAALRIFNLGQTVRYEDVPDEFPDEFIRKAYLKPVRQAAELASSSSAQVVSGYSVVPERLLVYAEQYSTEYQDRTLVIPNGDIELFLQGLQPSVELSLQFWEAYHLLVHAPLMEAVEAVRGIDASTPDLEIALILGSVRELVRGARIETEQLRGRRFFFEVLESESRSF